MNATVIMAKCKKTKESFGIRAEQRGEEWMFTWAFKLSDKVAAHEGYSKTNIKGAIRFDADYPGCPHCKAMGITQCGKCNKIACYFGEEKTVTCPHCGSIANVGIVESFDDISGGAF